LSRASPARTSCYFDEFDLATLDPNALATYAAVARKLQSGGLGEFLLNIVPTTVFDPFARNDVLHVLSSRVLFRIRWGWRNPPSASSFRRYSFNLDAFSIYLTLVVVFM
jgi:Na+/H+-dicarboxylate symporter